MKIAQVTKYFHPHRGGIESNVLGISQGLVERGNRVLIFTSNIPKGGKYEIPDGIEIHRSANFFTIFNDPFTPGIIIALLKEDYDLIHLHLPDPFNSIFAMIASILKKKPLVVTYHSDIIKDRWYHKPFKLVYNFFLYFVLRHAEKIIATTPGYADGSDTLRKFKNKIGIVSNFVDIGKFYPELYGGRIRELYNLENKKILRSKILIRDSLSLEAPNSKGVRIIRNSKEFRSSETFGPGLTRNTSYYDKKIILFLGRLVPYKGVEYLIKAFSDVKKEFKNSILVIAGNGPLKEELKNIAAGINDVHFVNVDDNDVPVYYASCDVFVLPSVTRQEAFGIALLEAMACGKPVITTNISGMPYVVGDAGVLVNPRDIAALKDAIIKIISDEKLSKTLGEKARRRVLDKFTYEKFMENMLRVYRDVISA